MAAYVVNQDSVITSLFVPKNTSFLTCGGTNIAQKSGINWFNFTASNPTTNFKYIFNSKNFTSGIIKPVVTGPSSWSPAPTTIKQFLYNGGSIEYVCGQFNIIAPTTAKNIMYFNPTARTTTGTTPFLPLSSISFAGSNNTVNCMAFLKTSDGINDNTSKLVIAGSFDNTTANGNIALLDVTPTPTWSINTSIIANTTINASTTIINSIIVIGSIIYVAGSQNNTDCLFYSYDTTTNAWSLDLLGVLSYSGTINILKKAVKQSRYPDPDEDITYIAIGGEFTDLASATVYNNIVLYNTADGSFTALGSGVTDVAAIDPIYPSPRVFALEYIESTNILWVGGYFLNADGITRNSIAYYDIISDSWVSIVINATSAVTGLLDSVSSVSSDPGVVYALYQSSIDRGNIIVGGSFKTKTTAVKLAPSILIYNLVKISIAANVGTTRNFTKFNSKSQ